MSLFVIVNDAAARAREAWPRVRETLLREGVRFDAHESARPGDTEKSTRTALGEGYHTVAVVGGDGTLSAAVSGYFQPCFGLAEGETPRAVNASAALAVLPAGTGDDFARGLTGGRREGVEAWLKRLVEHCRKVEDEGDAVSSVKAGATTRRVDVLAGSAGVVPGSEEGETRRFVCLNAATLGLGAEVAARVSSQMNLVRRLPGEARFAWAAVQSLAAWRARRVRVEVDGEVWAECDTNLLAVVNGPYAGGGMNFSPKADIADGLLDVLTVCGISRAGLVRELARVHTGGHLANPKVRLRRGTRVRIETVGGDAPLPIEADGDVRGHTPVEFHIMPAALRVVF